jgi:prevent-host-death family protein
MPKEIPAIKLRQNLGEVLDQVANHHQRFLVKRAGIPAAVILSVSDYEDLEDLINTSREQQNTTFQRSLIQARQEIASGKTTTLDELYRDLEVKERRATRTRRTPKRS